MPVLHNKIDQSILKQTMLQEAVPRTTLSFYKYFDIPNITTFRDELYQALEQLKVYGRIYVATEGINAQVSVPTPSLAPLQAYLYTIPSLTGIRLNIAVDDDGKSFWVLKIKIREKIVADGITDPTFNMNNKGKYVTPTQMNELIQQKDTIVVDMRNHYEYEVGHFNQAIPIPSDTFREQLPMAVDMLQHQKDKNIIMYCTGGIRCEKASAYMLHHGFTNVFHLEGGIINYANAVHNQGLDSEFVGKNFVFDGRLGERVTEDIIAQCHQCGTPADAHTNCANAGCHLLFIQCNACAASMQGCCSTACQEVINMPIDEQKTLRMGIQKGAHIFNKSKAKRLGSITPGETKKYPN